MFALPLAAQGARSARPDESHVAVSLVGEQTALVPGKVAWLGIDLKHEPHWHTYWVNPGDSGLPTKLLWELPPGFKVDEIVWPTPQRFTAAPVYNFGYTDQVMLLVPIEVPAAAKRGTQARLTVEVKWLVCREQCVPGKARRKLALPIAASAATDKRWSPIFARARAQQAQPATWSADALWLDDRIEVVLRGRDLPPAAALDAFTPQMRLLACAPPQVSQDGAFLHLSFARNEYFAAQPTALELVLTSGTPAKAWSVTAPFPAVPPASLKP